MTVLDPNTAAQNMSIRAIGILSNSKSRTADSEHIKHPIAKKNAIKYNPYFSSSFILQIYN